MLIWFWFWQAQPQPTLPEPSTPGPSSQNTPKNAAAEPAKDEKPNSPTLGTATSAQPEPKTSSGERRQIVIHVQDAEKKPISGGVVRLSAAPSHDLIYERRGNRQGKTAFSLPHADKYRVTAKADGYMPETQTFDSAKPVQIVSLTKRSGPLAEDGSMAVAGRVVDQQGRPIEKVFVSCTRCLDHDQRFETQKDGRFSFPKVFEGAQFQLYKRNHGRLRVDGFGQAYRELVLPFEPRLLGRVMDRVSNQPIESFRVEIRDDTNAWLHTGRKEHHPDGRFTVIDLPRETPLRAQFRIPDIRLITIPFELEPGNGDVQQTFWIDTRPGKISVQVVNEAGEPLTDARCKLGYSSGAGTRSVNQLGVYTHKNLLMGESYRITVSAPGYIPYHDPDIKAMPMDSDRDPEIITLTRGSEVTLIVNQEQYPAYRINAVTEDGDTFESEQRETGIFTFDGLPMGPATLVLHGENKVQLQITIEDPVAQIIHIGDPQRFTLAGQFFFSGKPTNPGQLVLFKEGQRVTTVRTDNAGRFIKNHLKPGRYGIGLVHSQNMYFQTLGDRAPFMRFTALTDEDQKDLVIDVAEPLRIVGCLSQATNIKLTGTMTSGAPYTELLSHTNDRKFVFNAVPPGVYEIYYEAGGPGSEPVILHPRFTLEENLELCPQP